MNFVNNAILSTNKMMLDDALRSLDYDKTLVCTIIDDSNAKNNRYKVQYQAIKFDAVALNGGEYKKDNQVFVTIPQGNWDNQKIILGAYGGEGSKGVVYQALLDKIIKASENLAPSDSVIVVPTKIGVDASINMNNDGNLNQIFEQLAGLAATKELGQFDAIGLRFKINNAIIENAVKGVYGIRIDIKYLNENKQAQTQTSWFKSDQFIGNPYWLDGFTQELLINYPKNAIIIQDIIITPELDSMFQDISGDEIKSVPEITFSDFEIYFGYEQFKVNNKALIKLYLAYGQEANWDITQINKEKRNVYYFVIYNNKIYNRSLLSWEGELNRPEASEFFVAPYIYDPTIIENDNIGGINYDRLMLEYDLIDNATGQYIIKSSPNKIKLVLKPSNISSNYPQDLLEFVGIDETNKTTDINSTGNESNNSPKMRFTINSTGTGNESGTHFFAYDDITHKKRGYNLNISVDLESLKQFTGWTNSGKIRYTIKSPIPHILYKLEEDNNSTDNNLATKLATQLSYFISSQDYVKDKDGNYTDSFTEPIWYPLYGNGTRYEPDENNHYNFSSCASVEHEFNINEENDTIPIVTIGLQNYFMEYEDNEIECILYNSSNKIIGTGTINLTFSTYNIKNSGYSIRITPSTNNGALIITGNNQTDFLELKASIYNENNSLLGEGIYENLTWTVVGDDKGDCLVNLSSKYSVDYSLLDIRPKNIGVKNTIVIKASITLENNNIVEYYPLPIILQGSENWNEDILFNCPSTIYYDNFNNIMSSNLQNILLEIYNSKTNINFKGVNFNTKEPQSDMVQIKNNKLIFSNIKNQQGQLFESIIAKKNNSFFMQPILIDNINSVSKAIDLWKDHTVSIGGSDDGTILSTSMIAGNKTGDDFTGVMIGDVSLSNGINNSGIYGFKDNNCRFYLNNNAEFFVGDNDKFIKFNNDGLNIKLNTNDRFDLSQDGNNFIRMDNTNGIQINNFKFINGQLEAHGKRPMSDKMVEFIEAIKTLYVNSSSPIGGTIYCHTYASENQSGSTVDGEIYFENFSWDSYPPTIIYKNMEDYLDAFYKEYLGTIVLQISVGKVKSLQLSVSKWDKNFVREEGIYLANFNNYNELANAFDVDGNQTLNSSDAWIIKTQGYTGINSQELSLKLSPNISRMTDGLFSCYKDNEIGFIITADNGIFNIPMNFGQRVLIGQESELNSLNRLESLLIVMGTVSANGFDNNSDPSIKTNIIYTQTNNALSLVNNLKLYDYNLKSNGSAIKLGLMSTEAPEAILGEDKKSINIYSYCGLLAKAVQELSNKLREKGVLD